MTILVSVIIVAFGVVVALRDRENLFTIIAGLVIIGVGVEFSKGVGALDRRDVSTNEVEVQGNVNMACVKHSGEHYLCKINIEEEK